MKLTKEEKISVGQRINKIRLSKGMTMEEFGNLLSTSKSIVYRWEIGKSVPAPERLKTIAKIADISVEELLYGTILRQHFNKYWTQLINKFKDTSKEYCIKNFENTSKEYCIKNFENTSKDDYNIDQKEFEYIKSNKERLYDIFYKNVLEYGYNNNDNNNIRLFKLSVYSLLKEYYISKEDNNFSHATIIQTVSKAIEQITLTAVNAGKQTTNIDDKMFYLKLVEITEEYAMQIDKLFKHIRQDNDENKL